MGLVWSASFSSTAPVITDGTRARARMATPATMRRLVSEPMATPMAA